MKKIFFLSLTVFFSFGIFAQAGQGGTSDSQSGGQVLLPDLTTTLEGDNVEVPEGAAPDFSQVQADSIAEKESLPKLPESNSQIVPEENVADGKESFKKEVYAEGQLGGGYPGFFTGLFQLYKDSLSNPFTLNFSHTTNNGYGRNSASQGYFSKTSDFDGRKKITFKNMEVNLQGAFSADDLGLQQRSQTFYDISKQKLSTIDSIEWTFPLGFGLLLTNNLSWYSRYSGLKDSSASYLAQEAQAASLIENPYMKFYWSNKVFTFALDGGYSFEGFFSDAKDSDLVTSINRGTFGAGLSYKKDIFAFDSAFNILVGNALGSQADFLVPFHLNVDFTWPVNYSAQPIRFSAGGGLKSSLPLFEEVEKNYSFAKMYHLATEESDWYAEASIQIPGGNIFSLDANVLFKTTAFSNGVWTADYENINSNNLYDFVQTSRTLLDSYLKATFAWNIFNLSFDCKSHWLYVPANEYQFMAGAAFDVNGASGLWGAKLEVKEAFGKQSQDLLPFINLSGYYRMTSSMRAAFEVNDIIKLFSGENRFYYNSSYSINSAGLALLLKFYL